MTRRIIGVFVTFALTLLVAALGVHAQSAKKAHRIGLLYAGSPVSDRANIEAFQQGLRDLGYVEGHTSSWNAAMPTGKWTGSARSPRSWSSSTPISSLPTRCAGCWQPSKPPPPSPSSWGARP
jgi:hypothetical protein